MALPTLKPIAEPSHMHPPLPPLPPFFPPYPRLCLTAQVRMGFPPRSAGDQSAAVHVGAEVKLLPGGYTCPLCRARAPELPCECHVCGLTLIASPHLARSYHHLFPVLPYEEAPAAALRDLAAAAALPRQDGGMLDGGTTHGPQASLHYSGSIANASSVGQPAGIPGQPGLSGLGGQGVAPSLACFGCLRDLSRAVEAAADACRSHAASSHAPAAGATAARRGAAAVPLVLQCGGCRQLFCFECDLYVHESLHNCPGCEVSGGIASSAH